MSVLTNNEQFLINKSTKLYIK